MIPEAAVEAGVGAHLAGHESHGGAMRAILEAARPYMNRAVASHGELEFMAVNSVVLSEETAYQYHGAGNWAGDGRWYETGQIALPATVLYEADHSEALQMIPHVAIGDAAEAIRAGLPRLSVWDLAKTALEAASPHLLSHERQQTADAHRDAIVNRDTVDRLERELASAKADAWEYGYHKGIEDTLMAEAVDMRTETGALVQPHYPNPYRSQA